MIRVGTELKVSGGWYRSGFAGGCACGELCGPARPAEETAKFLRADTQVYLSFNLRPASDQRTPGANTLTGGREHVNSMVQFVGYVNNPRQADRDAD